MAQFPSRIRLPAATEPEAVEGHTMTVIQGMSTLARDGANRAKLMLVARTLCARSAFLPNRDVKDSVNILAAVVST